MELQPSPLIEPFSEKADLDLLFIYWYTPTTALNENKTVLLSWALWRYDTCQVDG